jgi:hypothetical protein
MAPFFIETVDGFKAGGAIAIDGDRVRIGDWDLIGLIVQGARDPRCERSGGENREPATCLVTVQFFGA